MCSCGKCISRVIYPQKLDLHHARSLVTLACACKACSARNVQSYCSVGGWLHQNRARVQETQTDKRSGEHRVGPAAGDKSLCQLPPLPIDLTWSLGLVTTAAALNRPSVHSAPPLPTGSASATTTTCAAAGMSREQTPSNPHSAR